MWRCWNVVVLCPCRGVGVPLLDAHVVGAGVMCLGAHVV